MDGGHADNVEVVDELLEITRSDAGAIEIVEPDGHTVVAGALGVDILCHLVPP